MVPPGGCRAEPCQGSGQRPVFIRLVDPLFAVVTGQFADTAGFRGREGAGLGLGDGLAGAWHE